MKENAALPELVLEDWEETKNTLHLILQILGKTKLKLVPRKNHWWNITEIVVPDGFSTGPIPFHEGFDSFAVTLNVHRPQVNIQCSTGESKTIDLPSRISIAQFYKQYLDTLESMDIHPEIHGYAYDLMDEKSFESMTDPRDLNPESVRAFWRAMLWVRGVFEEFGGRFYGKTCPVQLYWHHMDLAVTRFSGKKAPAMGDDASTADKDAYSHEVVSFGFWGGDDVVREAAFYSYTYPSPDGLDQTTLQPEKAAWVDSNGSPMAFLSYDAVRESKHPRQTLLEFLESAYQNGAKLAGWNVAEMQVPELRDL